METPAPIALFVYNRIEHLTQTVEALKENILAADSDLYIFSDGAKHVSETEKISHVRSYLERISGFKSVTMMCRDKNMGLARSIIDGVTMLTDRFGKVIVVEDDLVTSRYFLRYLNDALNLYASDSDVISIHGYIYPVKKQLPETFFLRGADCWGWGTWKRGWDLFEPDGKKLLEALTRRNLLHRFDFDGSYGYSSMLKKQIAGKVDSWAVRWNASAFLNGKVTLYPGRSLVRNIGGDEFGTHTKSLDAFTTSVSNVPVAVKRIPATENAEARAVVVDFFRSIRPTIGQRIRSKIASLLG